MKGQSKLAKDSYRVLLECHEPWFENVVCWRGDSADLGGGGFNGGEKEI